MFGVLKDRHGAAELSEVRRQTKTDDRRAAEMMAEGNFHDALEHLRGEGRDPLDAQRKTRRAPRLSRNGRRNQRRMPTKTRFVFAYTNADVDQLNHDLARRAQGARRAWRGLRILDQSRKGRPSPPATAFRSPAPTSSARLTNGHAGTITSIEGTTIHLQLDGRAARTIAFDANEFKEFRHGYAGTIYKGQGRTLDQTYLYHSEHWRAAASYVALTRHRDKAEVFVARNTAPTLKDLARQMARVDDRTRRVALLSGGR